MGARAECLDVPLRLTVLVFAFIGFLCFEQGAFISAGATPAHNLRTADGQSNNTTLRTPRQTRSSRIRLMEVLRRSTATPPQTPYPYPYPPPPPRRRRRESLVTGARAGRGLELELEEQGQGQGLSQQKLQLSVGPCVLQLYEPCSDHGSIVFYLFRSVDGRPSVLSVTNPYLPETFDPSLPTKVLIHGFAGSVEFNFTSSVRQAYLLRGGCNVLVVDWGWLTKLPCYPSSVINTWQVARCTAQLLAGLSYLSPSLAPERLHLVGFSLGAHIAAYISNELLSRVGRRIGRISGLDPALPAFASLSHSWKLDPEDADFVDVVHTNAGVFGKVEPMGHADFYVNGGLVQPFCRRGNRNVPLCSHLLAPVYFAESILDEHSHWGRNCPSFGHYAWGYCPVPSEEALLYTRGTFMGEGADPRVHGTFIVETASTPPFALGSPVPRPLLPAPTPSTDTVLVLLSE